MNVQERSLKELDLPSVIMEEGLVVDNLKKSFVSSLPPNHPKYFSVIDVSLLKEHYIKNHGRLAVVLERRDGSDRKPEWRMVRKIDGNVLELESAFNYQPRQGACVAVLLGFSRDYFSEEVLDKQSKEQDIRWI